MRPGAKRPPTHPAEPACPCCLPALGEFGEMPPHGGLPASLRGGRTSSESWAVTLGLVCRPGRSSDFVGRSRRGYPPRRRIRLVAYGARLESGLGASPQGFESPILRHSTSTQAPHASSG